MRRINCVVLIWAWNPGSPLRVTGARLLSQTGGAALCCPQVIRKKNTFTASKEVRLPLCASFLVFVLFRPLMDDTTHSQKSLPHSVHWDKCQSSLKCLSSIPSSVSYHFFKGSLNPVVLTAMISHHTSAKRPFTVYLLLMSLYAFRPHIQAYPHFELILVKFGGSYIICYPPSIVMSLFSSQLVFVSTDVCAWEGGWGIYCRQMFGRSRPSKRMEEQNTR